VESITDENPNWAASFSHSVMSSLPKPFPLLVGFTMTVENNSDYLAI
jgi:hypothetical protein